jgi:opacity protein-like surface antigen
LSGDVLSGSHDPGQEVRTAASGHRFRVGAALDAKFSEHLSAGIEFSWAINNNGLEGRSSRAASSYRADQYEYTVRQYGLRGRYSLNMGTFHPYALWDWLDVERSTTCFRWPRTGGRAGEDG